MKDFKNLTDSELENLREEIEMELCERKNFNFLKYKVGEVYIKKYEYDGTLELYEIKGNYQLNLIVGKITIYNEEIYYDTLEYTPSELDRKEMVRMDITQEELGKIYMKLKNELREIDKKVQTKKQILIKKYKKDFEDLKSKAKENNIKN